jgi:predicted kinase
MRKWMRERIQRKKKQAEEKESQPAPPPLQPAYFDAEDAERTEPETSHNEPVEITREPEVDAQASTEEPARSASQKPKSSSSSGGGQRARGRRRRGGRGRGGRGREQAVAQAFTPKGIPVVPAEEPEAPEPEASLAEPAVEAEPTDVEPAPEPLPQAPPAPAIVPSAPARLPKGIVVLAIGLPGSGKSSWFKRHNVTPLSSDMVRSLLFDDVREQRFQDLVFSNLRSMLKARLIARRPMNYVDATNLTPHERQHWIKLAKDYNYEVHAVFFDVPLEVCIERHQRRDRVVPEDVMRRMAAKLKPPSFQEGFAKITVVRVKKKDEEPAERAGA